jgi:Fe(3+) dicitrate transport protein
MRTVAGRGGMPEGTGVDGFAVLNLSAEWNLDANSTVYAAVQNLTNERYIVARRPAGVRPGLPRTAFVGLRLRR